MFNIQMDSLILFEKKIVAEVMLQLEGQKKIEKEGKLIVRPIRV